LAGASEALGGVSRTLTGSGYHMTGHETFGPDNDLLTGL
jgi:hypothetical protein